MKRLSYATLAHLPPSVTLPGYDRTAIRPGVVHLGLGAFTRAHQATVFEAALASGDLRWGITGVSLRSSTVRDSLVEQDNLYTLVVRDGGTEQAQVIGCICAMLVAPENPAKVVAALASPDTHIVTLTITEKGYKLDPATGALLMNDPDVAADLASLAQPRTAPGFLVAGLAARRAAGLPPFTAISCDNLRHNGQQLKAAVLAMANTHDVSLADWIAKNGAFPETMVDRIVPATSREDIANLSARTGLEDRATIKTEPFVQWVIEDRFCGPRPDFPAFGVHLTADVGPWEAAKLRLLNGAHSAIAYLGGLAGIEFVHEFVAQAAGRRFVEALWDEATPTLLPPPELDLARYRAELMARFANPALQHRTHQIAMDGSQKIPQRLLTTIAARRIVHLPTQALSLAVAAWIRWQGGRDDSGNAFIVDDPLAAITAAALASAQTAADQVAAVMAIEAIFPPSLADDSLFCQTLVEQLDTIHSRGAAGAVDEFARQSVSCSSSASH